MGCGVRVLVVGWGAVRARGLTWMPAGAGLVGQLEALHGERGRLVLAAGQPLRMRERIGGRCQIVFAPPDGHQRVPFAVRAGDPEGAQEAGRPTEYLQEERR